MGKFLILYLISFMPVFVFSGESPLAGDPCAEKVAKQLNRWSTSQNWKLEGTESSTKTYLSPTPEIGSWMELQLPQKGQGRVTLRTPNKIVDFFWDRQTCKSAVSTTPLRYNASKMKTRFTDEDLQKLVDRSEAGLIYAWSPHMPLSMSGMRQARKAAEKLGIPMTVVLDPHANDKIASRSAVKSKMDASALKKIESIELINRKMCMHFPAVLLYSNGKIVGPVYAGYKPEERYVQFIKKNLTPN